MEGNVSETKMMKINEARDNAVNSADEVRKTIDQEQNSAEDNKIISERWCRYE
jgi:hypothetical protein